MRPTWEVSGVRAYHGDARERLRFLPAASAHTCVTSPPHFGGLRDYGHADQLGREATVDLHVRRLVEVMREVRRVLRPDGTLWLNLGDSYGSSALHARARATSRRRGAASPLRAKNLIGVPWRVALALEEDGWLLRNDIIWRKANAAPESVTDRFTRSHEHLFLLTPSSRYFFDAVAVREPAGPAKSEGARSLRGQSALRPRGRRHLHLAGDGTKPTRNRRDVWDVAVTPYHEAHLATYPQALVEPCILAGTSAQGCCSTCGAPWERARAATDSSWRPGCACQASEPVPCTVLDPFFGAATTGVVALRHHRRCVGIELNQRYLRLACERVAAAAAPASTVAPAA